jgi:hypothetical protein
MSSSSSSLAVSRARVAAGERAAFNARRLLIKAPSRHSNPMTKTHSRQPTLSTVFIVL